MFNIFDNAVNHRGFLLHKTVLVNIIIGHATLIGESTKKCLGFSVMSKRCRICTNAKKREPPPRKHACSCNWTASAKSMEPAMACEMLQDIMNTGKQVFLK